MPPKVTEHIPRQKCTKELLTKLRSLKVRTNGATYQLEKILQNKGFTLPKPHQEVHPNSIIERDENDNLISVTKIEETTTYYRFMFRTQKAHFIGFYLNYADALAKQIIKLKEYKLF